MPGYAGEIRIFAGDFIPEGWLHCDGRTLKASEYPVLASLFEKADGTYVYGGGGTEFKLPLLAGLVAVGAGAGPGLTSRELGTTGGSETAILGLTHLAAHTHPVVVSADPATTRMPGNTMTFAAVAPQNRFYADVTKPISGQAMFSALAIGNTGGHEAHENRMPYVALHYIICVDGEFPEAA